MKRKLTFSTLLKNIYIYFPSSPIVGSVHGNSALSVFFFFYLMLSPIFTDNYHNVLYVYLCTEAI